MENNHPEAAPVKLGGEERTLKLTLLALDIAATRHGYTFSLALLSRIDYASLPRLVWAGLLEDDPDLPFEKVAAWMQDDPEGAAPVAGAALVAFNRLTPLLKSLKALRDPATKNGAAKGGGPPKGGKVLAPAGP